MVFHWSLSDSKYPQVSRIFLGIHANLNNTVVGIVSTCLLILKSSCPCTNPVVTVSSAPITIGFTVTFMFHIFFSSLAYLTFCFLSVLSCGQLELVKSTILFFVTIMWSSRLAEIRWSIYLKNPAKFVRLILQYGFWVVIIPYVRLVKLKLLARFLVDHLPHPVVSSFQLFLR